MGRSRLVVLASSLLAAALFAQTNGPRDTGPSTTWSAYGGGADSSQ